MNARRIAPGDLVGPNEIAEILDVSRSWIYNLRSRGDFLEPFAVVSGHPVWVRGDVERWWTARAATLRGGGSR